MSEQDPPTRAPTRARYTAAAFTLALIGVAYLDRVCIATAAPAIKRDLALSDAAMGLVFSAFTFAYALPTYLLRARGFDLKQAGWLAALPLLAIGLGVLAGGWVSDALTWRWGQRAGRRASGLVGLPLAALAVLGAVGTPDPMRAALLLAAAAGLAALGVAPAWAVCLEIGGVHAGVVSGAMNTLGNLGGAASPIVVGIALDRWNSWQAPLVSVAALYVVSALCWLAIDPAQRIETVEVRR